MEDFIRQNQLPLTVPINSETLKLVKDDERKIVLTIVEDELDENSLKLVRILRSAATANRDLIFGYVGVKQWGEFVDTFDISKRSKLPKLLVWDGKEDYHIVSSFLHPLKCTHSLNTNSIIYVLYVMLYAYYTIFLNFIVFV